MQPPQMEIRPSRAAVRDDVATTLDILVTITPPVPDIHILRQPINLAIVLDRSGSMAGQKIVQARQAARFAAEQLLATDRLSVTIFDEQIETIVPSAEVKDKPAILARIDRITARGSTALHGGWAAGAAQVLEHLQWQALNRVLLLSDGLANVGLTEPDAITAEVGGMAAREVSTSTIGVGNDYNENLLSAMSQAGAGNYYYVDDPVQLTDIFQTELNGLMATTGKRVTLAFRPAPGVSLTAMLSTLQRGPDGQVQLPDLVCGMPIFVLFRVEAAPQTSQAEIGLFELTWDAVEGTAAGRGQLSSVLTLPAVSSREWDALPEDVKVRDRVTLVESVQSRDQLHEALSAGRVQDSKALLDDLAMKVRGTSLGEETHVESEMIEEIRQKMDAGDLFGSTKIAHYFSHQPKTGRGSRRRKPPGPPGEKTP